MLHGFKEAEIANRAVSIETYTSIEEDSIKETDIVDLDKAHGGKRSDESEGAGNRTDPSIWSCMQGDDLISTLD